MTGKTAIRAATTICDPRGTACQQHVWQALQKIPAGTTASYTEIAQRIGAPESVRAAAGGGSRVLSPISASATAPAEIEKAPMAKV